MFRRMTALSLALVLCAGSVSMAQTNKPSQGGQKGQERAANRLKVGDKAPKLSIEEWVKGDEVEKLEGGKVYVVEFWATWCPPCIDSIPHLTKIQKEHKEKGLTVIGVAASERGNSAEKSKKLKDFVAKQGSKMEYSVGYDPDSSMSRDWSRAAGQNSIPHAFVVGRDSKIAFIGHPMDPGFDAAIKKAISQKAEAAPGMTPEIHLASWQPERPQKKGEQKKAQPKEETEKPRLTVGDKAPEIQVAKFVKGEPITGFERGKTYVVEFWATWCPPCVDSIPHLTELQKKHKDKGLRVLGVSVWENNQGAVEPFVEEMGDKMQYAVAMDKLPRRDPSQKAPARRDSNEGHMAKTWMSAAGQNGIPAAFIVNGEGRIAWIGHPMKMDEPLEKILAGDWDIEKEAKRQRQIADSEKLLRDFQTAARQSDTDRLLDIAAQLVEIEHPAASQVVHLSFKHILVDEQEYDRAYGWARKVIQNGGNSNAEVLNSIAWTIVDPENEDIIEKKDLDLALQAAKRADELTKNNSAHIIDTLAKVYFDKGDVKRAHELQKKAVDLSVGTVHEDELRDRLAEYEEALKDRR